MWKEDRRAELLRDNRDSSWLLDSQEDSRGRATGSGSGSGSGSGVSSRHEENLARREKLKELQRSKLKTREAFYGNDGESSKHAGGPEKSKANGEGHRQAQGPVEQKKKYLPFDNFGSFFGPTEPVVSRQVIEQIRAREEQARIAQIEGRPRVGAESADRKKLAPAPKPIPKPVVKKRPVDEATKKALALRESRDYSFLDSDEPLNGPGLKKAPAPPTPPAKNHSTGKPSALPSGQKPAARDSRDVRDIRNGKDGRDGRDGRVGRDGRDSRDGRDLGRDGRDVRYGSRDGSRDASASKQRMQGGGGRESTKMQAPMQHRGKESLANSSRLAPGAPGARVQPTLSRPVPKPGASSQPSARAPPRPGAYPTPKTSAIPASRPVARPGISKPSSAGAGSSSGVARPASVGARAGGELKTSDPRARGDLRKPPLQDARRMPAVGLQRPNVTASTSRLPVRHVDDMQRRPPPRPVARTEAPRRREDLRRPRSDDEDSMDDFIDDGDDPAAVSSIIQRMFGRNRATYHDSDEEDDKCMEVGFSRIQEEERRSARIAREEDERELEAIEAEERAERLRRKKRRL